MNISQRLRTCAKHTALDAVIELLNEAADEIDRLSGWQQAEAKTDEPVAWEWRHQGSHPDAVDFGQWSEWKRVEPRSLLHTVDDALREFKGYIARGHKYELRALYTHPAPGVPDVVVRDAERYRWLRATTNWASSKGERIDVRNNPELWDSAIDAAILAASPAQKGGE